jgi:hypothetical protein
VLELISLNNGSSKQVPHSAFLLFMYYVYKNMTFVQYGLEA